MKWKKLQLLIITLLIIFQFFANVINIYMSTCVLTIRFKILHYFHVVYLIIKWTVDDSPH